MKRKKLSIPPENPWAQNARTDLAMEERELWHQEAGQATRLPGVYAHETKRRGILTTVVKILNDDGVKELHKPVGTYITLELDELQRRTRRAFHRVTETLAGEMAALMQLPKDASVLVVGLGNPDITPDAIGPLALRRLLVTRHLVDQLPESFGKFRSVSALQPGVLGSTGLESAEIVRAVVEKSKPDSIVVIDALAARSLGRLCSTVQLADSGIIPGSGVGNHRAAFTRETLGVPVYAVGVPTVADAAPLLDKNDPPAQGADLIVTPRSMDAQCRKIANVIACSLNLALHSNLTREQISEFVEIP